MSKLGKKLIKSLEEATALVKVHGTDNCHICGKPKIAKGASFCSYPHGMLPDKAIDP